MTLIKSISGIRGTIGGKVGDNLTPVDAVKFASAYGTFLKQNIAKDKFQFIPLQNFTSTSDIDWSQSLADIDRQLYAKYGLSEEEVAFIEGMIKGMG